MKKQLLLFAFSVLALTSCEDDDYQAYEVDLMKGNWKVSKTETISGKDNKTIIGTEVPLGCSVNDTYEFRTDYYTSFTAYTGTGTNCQMAPKTEGEFTYDEETKNLVITYKGFNSMPYKVLVLTSQEMKIMPLFSNSDQDGDTVIDYKWIYLKR